MPSHIGLSGNETVDRIAKGAHINPTIIPCPLSVEEVKQVVKRAATTFWQMVYDTQKDETHIGTIKITLEQWPWAHYRSRAIETAVARLRIGHVELNAHLHRFGQIDSPLCPQCGTPESVSHYLLYCSSFIQSRRKLTKTLNNLGIPVISKKTLLGGGTYPQSIQVQIAKALETFLRESRRLYGLSSA